MNFGDKIAAVRKEHGLTQEAFGEIFHVTRQTVSGWETNKSYPDLQTILKISDTFEISLDSMLKGDSEMIKSIDKDRFCGSLLKRQQTATDIFIGLGAGLTISCVFSPASAIKNILVVIGVSMLLTGILMKSHCDKIIAQYLSHSNKQDC